MGKIDRTLGLLQKNNLRTRREIWKLFHILLQTHSTGTTPFPGRGWEAPLQQIAGRDKIRDNISIESRIKKSIIDFLVAFLVMYSYLL